ncbi:hypothetical protein [Peribacillus kribbensis]|nr:hypothetical protein [Peribacillus kribbensis]
MSKEKHPLFSDEFLDNLASEINQMYSGGAAEEAPLEQSEDTGLI